MKVMSTGRDVRDERVYLAEYNRFVEQSVVYDKDSHLIIAIMRDVTDEQNEREKKEKAEKFKMNTAGPRFRKDSK
jgi:hypothetical protein